MTKMNMKIMSEICICITRIKVLFSCSYVSMMTGFYDKHDQMEKYVGCYNCGEQRKIFVWIY